MPANILAKLKASDGARIDGTFKRLIVLFHVSANNSLISYMKYKQKSTAYVS
jgi:hypothetical protein